MLQEKPAAKAKGSVKVDVVVIGAGPTGLACAIEAQKAGASVLVIEKGCVVNSIYHYPAQMTFFTTPELLEIGDIPFPCAHQKPNREEALQYYRRVAEHYRLRIHQYERVLRAEGEDNKFRVITADRYGASHEYRARKLILSTGYYDLPNHLGVPGEQLPKVMHYYADAHPYYDTDVVVIGGKNSAAIAALDLWRNGARVTLVHRGPGLHKHVKYWILPDLENRIRDNQIMAHFNTRVVEVLPESVMVESPEETFEIKNDFVFALVGYHPDYEFLKSFGIELLGEHRRPACDPETLESNVPGIYVAGVIVAGSRTNEIFIENGRFHGKHIADDLRRKLSSKL